MRQLPVFDVGAPGKRLFCTEAAAQFIDMFKAGNRRYPLHLCPLAECQLPFAEYALGVVERADCLVDVGEKVVLKAVLRPAVKPLLNVAVVDIAAAYSSILKDVVNVEHRSVAV